ncbi:MAG: XdhC family protein [Chloroflexi bacterium]|nr:XdhC family protein [Chloroflexota bacterium]
MEPVFREALALAQKGEPFVIATVVDTKGSTPQKAGAKLLIRRDGSGVGTLGGGCVEGDIWFAAKEIIKHHGGPEYKDYYLNEDIAAHDGLVCGGTMYFFIDPVWEPASFLPIAGEVTRAYEGDGTVALATLIKPGTAGGQTGAKLFLRGDGSTLGTLGGPEVDQLALETAERLAPYGQCEHVLSDDGAELFVEAYTSPATIVLMGGGHVSRAVATIAHALGFRLFVVDDRREFANKERFPEAEEVAVAGYDTALSHFSINPNTAILIATRGHNFDDVALESAARSPAGYVGLVGSQRKVILIYEELLRRDVPLERLREVHSPVGLDIHSRTPMEIAVSIMAEVIAHRLGGTGQPMKLPEQQLMRIYKKVQAEKAAGIAAPTPHLEGAQPLRG